MFHLKTKIAASLALAFLVTSSATFAASKTKQASPQPVPAAVPAVTNASTPVADYTSTAALKLRGGKGDPVAGADKAALCQGCHGEEGISTEPLIPKLAGQYGNYIAKQVRNYQAGIRTHQIMGAVAATVTEDELADIAAFFANKPMMSGGGSGANNQLGKDLFLNGDMSRMLVACAQCHGVTGKGKTPDNSAFPVLGGQHKDYLLGQLINFRLGDRSNSPGGVMNIMVQRLNDNELEALADYIAGL
ncbi:MAG: c-type cytochrome [Gallionella sp.]|nr:c-type cytochrome [Gallionella sp.]